MTSNAEQKSLAYFRKNVFFMCSYYYYDELRVARKHQRQLSKKCQKEPLKSGVKPLANPIIFANRGT